MCLLYLCYKTKAEKHLDDEEKEKCLLEFLGEKFPVKIWIFSIILNISSALVVIGLQIGLIWVKGKNYYVGAG